MEVSPVGIIRARIDNAFTRSCWVALYVASFVISNLACALQYNMMFLVFKSLFVPAVSLLAFLIWPRPLNKQYYLLQLAFLLAWVGDVFIGLAAYLPWLFIPGCYSFLFQHFVYIWMNGQSFSKPSSILHMPYWGLPHIAYVVLFSISYFACISGTEQYEYMLYAFSLGTGFFTSFHRETLNRVKYWTVVMGFGFFVASDFLLSINRYLYKFSDAGGCSILVTYYIAQTLICLGVTPDYAEQKKAEEKHEHNASTDIEIKSSVNSEIRD
ncbi:MAG: lysoplasmalogenase [Candidatus Pacebacteria bacterium]|nr:lysoplasmalogenase [Candidatus Paceibacterota bacterium]